VRTSIHPTYDSRETGPSYHVTTQLDDRTIAFQQPIDDPFVRHTVRIGWRDLLRGLLRRHLVVTVVLGARPSVVEDVLELDANYLGIGGSTRRDELHATINQALGGIG
jgi:hypothetical protein